MKKTLTLILSLIMILSMVTGCQKVAQASSSAAPSSAGAPAAEGEKKTEGDQKTTEISIPTSNLTGTWYIWGSALSKVINDYVDGYTASPQVTDGPLADIQMIEDDEALLTLGNSAVCYEAWNGEGIASPDGTKYQKQRALFMAYPSYFHNITTTKTGVKNIADLEGRVVACAPAGSGPNYSIEYSMKALNITPKEKIYGGVDAAYELLKDNNIANVVLAMGIPVGTVTDFALNYDMAFVEYTDEQLKTVCDTYPFLTPAVIPAGTYNGQDHDVNTVSFGNMIIAHQDMDADLAYEITKACFEHQDYFINAHSTGNDMTEEAFVNCSVPLHPGAIRYFEEKGYEIPEKLIPPEMK